MRTVAENIEGVAVETTYDEKGVMIHQKFMTDEQPNERTEQNKSGISRFFSWFLEHLYLKRRNLADPFGERDDIDGGKDGKTGIEIGLKWKF